MKEVYLYTDGACSGNPGDGGYCAILIYNGIEKVISGAVKNVTNNQMELLAAIKGLEALKESCSVKLYSDSAYLVNAFRLGWIKDWERRGWKTADKSPVKNLDMWKRLLELCGFHLVKFIKVKGHSDNEYNNRCDKIAVAEYKKMI